MRADDTALACTSAIPEMDFASGSRDPIGLSGGSVKIIVGIFFVVMQFSTVFLFDSMMTISQNHALPTEQLERLQIAIMNVVLYSLIGFGVMFLSFMAALIRNVLKYHDRPESEPAK